ncbi:hypothetical protein GDO81_004055 [Engystomops pustulosus]|uniref:Carboxylesterase type B domain-containing protein n=1 Tax=Engystomops pustulosus TaxID=76066 RepID=A0AAV6ZPP0_ENGPU|nr:hypothetical protein GDO81_004055 [Engystomops pustulosus]
MENGTPEEQSHQTDQREAKISDCDLASIADCLRKKSEKDFIDIATAMGMQPFPASVDGAFLPKPPEEMLANKESNKVPFIIGVNNDEFGWISHMVGTKL